MNTSILFLLPGWLKFAIKTIFTQPLISLYCSQCHATEHLTENALLRFHCHSGYANGLQCHSIRNTPIPFYNRVNWSDIAISLTDTSLISAFLLSWYVTLIEALVWLKGVPTFQMNNHVITEEYYSWKSRLFVVLSSFCFHFFFYVCVRDMTRLEAAEMRFLLTFKRRIKSRLPFAGIIRSSPYSPLFLDKG